MSVNESDDRTIYKVVLNHEEQYSIWPAHRQNPLGWNDAGKAGSKEERLAYIKELWTDMRPLSLRKKMEEMEARVRMGDHSPNACCSSTPRRANFQGSITSSDSA